jgi:hypothetical protein
VKGVDEVGVRFACRGVRSRGGRRSEIEVDSKRRGLRHVLLLTDIYIVYWNSYAV